MTLEQWIAKFKAAGWTLLNDKGDLYLFNTKADPEAEEARPVTEAQLQAEYDEITGGSTKGTPNIVFDEKTNRYYLYKGVDAKGNEVWDDLSASKGVEYFTSEASMNKALTPELRTAGYWGLQTGEGTWVIQEPRKEKAPSRQFFGPTAQADATQWAANSPDSNDYPSQMGNSDVWEVVTRPKITDLEGAWQEAILNGDFARATEIKGYIDQFSARDKLEIQWKQEADTEKRIAAAETRGTARAAEVQRQKEAQREFDLSSYKTQMEAWGRARQLGQQQGLEAQKAQYLGVLGALNPPAFGPEGIPKPDFLSQAGERPVAPVSAPPYPKGFESFTAQNTPGALGQPVQELTPEEKTAAIERYRRQQLALTSPAQTGFTQPSTGKNSKEFALPLTDEQAATAELERRRRMAQGDRTAQLMGIAEG